MRNVRLSVITLKKRDFKEKDRIITCLTREVGKYDFVAKGVQKPGSRLSGICEPFAYGSVIVGNLKDLGTVSSADQRESFSEIHSDLNRLSHGLYLLELTDKSTAYGNPSEDIFDILYAALIMLEGKTDPEICVRFFEHRLINALGYRINTESCIGCGKDLEKVLYYSREFGGFLCEKCSNISLSSQTFPYALISYIKAFDTNPIQKIKEFSFPEQVNRDLSTLYKQHLSYRIEKEMHSLDFIKKVKDEL